MFFFLLILLFIQFRPAYAGQGLAGAVIGKDGVEMALIPAGEFIMGSSEDDLKKDVPEHSVYADAFYMDRYEMTNAGFAEYLNSINLPDYNRWKWLVIRNDIETDERASWWPTEIIYEDGVYKALEGYEMYPVITVNWQAADAYCRWAGKRLPTEAEWEKAARGGLSKKSYPWGNEIPTGGLVFERTWHDNNDPAPTGRVGNYHPNGYGIYDMAGNVWEWCSDWYDKGYYKNAPKNNPTGPVSGQQKVIRGGSWYNASSLLRVAVRNSSPPDAVNDGVGFRCVMDAKDGR